MALTRLVHLHQALDPAADSSSSASQVRQYKTTVHIVPFFHDRSTRLSDLSHPERLLQQPSRQPEPFERLLSNGVEGLFGIQPIAHDAVTGPDAQVHTGCRKPIERTAAEQAEHRPWAPVFQAAAIAVLPQQGQIATHVLAQRIGPDDAGDLTWAVGVGNQLAIQIQ